MNNGKTKKKKKFPKMVKNYDPSNDPDGQIMVHANRVYDSDGKCLKNRLGKLKDLVIKKSTAEFAKTYQPFIKACEKAGVEPSKNEASKYRRGFGIAITFSNEQWRVLPHQGKGN